MSDDTVADWTIETIDQVKDLAADCGSHFFEPATMRFFRSRVCTEVEPLTSGGALFVTSEQFVSSHGEASPRLYTVRLINRNGNFKECGSFQQYPSKATAVRAMRHIAAWLNAGYDSAADPALFC